MVKYKNKNCIKNGKNWVNTEWIKGKILGFHGVKNLGI